MRRWLPLVVLGLACHKAPPIPDPLPDEVAVEVVDTDEAESGDGVVVVGPARWSGGGLGLEVPEGWRARAGTGDVVVRLTHTSGVQVRVRRPADPPALGGDCAWTFDDHVGRHRDVPLLYPASTATCLPRAATAPVVQAWWGAAGGAVVQVEIRYPPGTLAAGRDAARPVLLSLEAE